MVWGDELSDRYQLNEWSCRRWEKINVAKRQHRFYQVEIRQDLFGDWLLVKSWGRIGQRPSQIQCMCLPTLDEARLAMERTAQIRRRHHYVEVQI